MSGCGAGVAGNIRCCGEPGRAIRVGCAHEHISETFVCARHLDVMTARRGACAKCYRSSDPHRCVLSLLSERVAR